MAPKTNVMDSIRNALPEELGGPGKKDKDSLLLQVANFIDDLQKKPPPVQMGVGGGFGLVSGYLFTKGSKATATVLGISLIVFQHHLSWSGCFRISEVREEESTTSTMDSIVDHFNACSPCVRTALLAPVGIFALCKLAQWMVPGPQHLARFNYKDKTVLITGASTGLGRDLARELHARGARLILVARSLDKLKEVAEELQANGGHEVKYAYLDLADPEKIAELVQLSHNGVIDVLVNNAGISMRGSVMESDLSVHRKVLEVNYFGQVAVTKALLKYIPDDGMIIVTSSLQAKMAVPYRSAYSASKHAVQAFFDSLRGEERWGLHILTVAAGYIKTDLGQNALNTAGQPTGSTDANVARGMDPRVAAKRIADAGERRELEIVLAPLAHRIGIFLRWLWPSYYFYHMYKRAVAEKAAEKKKD